MCLTILWGWHLKGYLYQQHHRRLFRLIFQVWNCREISVLLSELINSYSSWNQKKTLKKMKKAHQTLCKIQCHLKKGCVKLRLIAMALTFFYFVLLLLSVTYIIFVLLFFLVEGIFSLFLFIYFSKFSAHLVHRTAREGGGHSINSSLSLPTASQTLRH